MMASGKKGRAERERLPETFTTEPTMPRASRSTLAWRASRAHGRGCAHASVEPTQRIVESAQRQLAPHRNEHLENTRTDGHAGQRDPQRLEDLAPRDAPLLRELAKRALYRVGCPRLHLREPPARRAQDIRGSGSVLPVLMNRLLLVQNIGGKVRRGLPHDVADRPRANLEEIDQREIPVTSRRKLVRRGDGRVEHHRGDDRLELDRRRKAEMLAVHPLELLRIEDRRLLLQPVGREELDHFAERHHLAIAARRPPEKRQEIHHRARQNSLMAIVPDRSSPVPLAELLAVEAVDHRYVRELRKLRAERAIE